MTPAEIDKSVLDGMRVTYQVTPMTRSSTHPASADRPWCAAVAAYRSARAGNRLGGSVGGASARQHVSLVPLEGSDRHLMGDQPVTAGPVDVQLGPYTLDPYQTNAVVRMRNGGVILDYKVGLGKTVTALACARAYLSRWVGVSMLTGLVLVVCPLNAVPVWKDARVWAEQELGAKIEIVSADSLHTLNGLYVPDHAVLIIDEAHYFGSATAERTKQAHALRWRFSCAILLTGSMLTAGPEKILSLLDLCCPGAAGFANKWDLGREFSSVVDKPIPGTKRIAKEVVRPTGADLDRWNTWLERWVVSKTKRSPDVIESIQVPDQTVHTVQLDRPAWKPIVEDACAVARQILADTGTLPSMMEVTHRLARAGLDAKLEWLAEQMAGNSEQVVLFASYHETLDAVQAQLETEGVTFARVDGSVKAKDRARFIADFTAGKHRVFLAQTDAASVSMNLQCANVSVMLDATTKASAKEQAMGRTCRRGSTHQCHHFDLVANSFQAAVFKRLELALDFNASSAEWQDMRAGLKGLIAWLSSPPSQRQTP